MACAFSSLHEHMQIPAYAQIKILFPLKQFFIKKEPPSPLPVVDQVSSFCLFNWIKENLATLWGKCNQDFTALQKIWNENDNGEKSFKLKICF